MKSDPGFFRPARHERTSENFFGRSGFAAAPGLVQAFAVFGGPTRWICGIAIVWALVASVVAVRQALDYDSTARAIAVCGLAWLLSLGMVALFGSVVALAR